MAHRRLAGIVCPVSSLPSHWGIGDFGPAAYDFVDWLAAAGQTYWQVLPLSIPDSVGSPYASPSSLAGSWLYLSPEQLVADGLFPASAIPRRPVSSQPVRYREVNVEKKRILWQSFLVFEKSASPRAQKSFAVFLEKNDWLGESALFQAVKDQQRGWPWWRWPKKFHDPKSARRHLTPRLARRQLFHLFLQWQFTEQWGRLRQYAHRRGLKIIGDLPFYAQRDSVEVWAHPELFMLDRRGQPTMVAGTPPDGFNKHGQYWGNPVYRWAAHRRSRFAWWTERLTVFRTRFDLIRFDHFRGLVSTWHIPAKDKDGRRGRWVASPGTALLQRWKSLFGRLPIVAEDLGHHTPLVTTLRRRFKIDAVRVLIFGWNGLPENFHQPDYLAPDSFYYTSIHDTNTINGWWRDEAKDYEREKLKNYLGGNVTELHWQAIAAVYRNREHVAMVAIQDVLGLGTAGRINRPGKKLGNWKWRLSAKALTPEMAKRLHYLVNHAK